jgi:hypothetical protein
MMIDIIRQALYTASLTALLAASANSLAQSGQQGYQQGYQGGDPGQAASPPASGESASILDVDEATVERFAVASVEVQRMSRELTEEMNAASNVTEAQELQRKAQEEMAQAVEEEGISVREYNEIATAMQQDPALAARINAKIEAIQ